MISEADIEALFASILGRIEDQELRAKVVKAWGMACERGGWETVDELKAMPFTLLTETRGINFIEHTVVSLRSPGSVDLLARVDEALIDILYSDES